MNVYDSELVGNLLQSCNYIPTDDIHKANIVLLNTCAIREKAEETVHNRLDGLHFLKKNKPDMILGLLGCMAQNLKDDILESKPYVDIILGPDSYRRIPEIIKLRSYDKSHLVDTKLSKFEIYDDIFPSRNNGINAWISIMRGCDKFCTFCIVPFTRGRERSRSIESVVNEVEVAVSQGFIEITLLGQNVNSYSTPNGGFSKLLRQVACVSGLKRIRYTSPHPQDVDDELLEVMRDHENICNYIHLPLQSGSNRILTRMNRTYTRENYLLLVDKIRSYLPNCSISTDIIVGFPGETEEEFVQTLDVMEKVNFDFSFMFKYSSRPGTKAAEYSDQIDESVKQNRLERLIALQRKNTLKSNLKYIGKTVSVIIEKVSKKSDKQWSGRTEGNIWVVFDKENEQIKDCVKIKIEDAKGVTLFGSKVENKEMIHEAA